MTASLCSSCSSSSCDEQSGFELSIPTLMRAHGAPMMSVSALALSLAPAPAPSEDKVSLASVVFTRRPPQQARTAEPAHHDLIMAAGRQSQLGKRRNCEESGSIDKEGESRTRAREGSPYLRLTSVYGVHRSEWTSTQPPTLDPGSGQ